MGSLKRKIARKQMLRAKKEMRKQLTMFDKLSDKCAACETPFDKKSKEHAKTWKVIVREKEEVVRLYCPECWSKAEDFIKEIKNEIN